MCVQGGPHFWVPVALPRPLPGRRSPVPNGAGSTGGSVVGFRCLCSPRKATWSHIREAMGSRQSIPGPARNRLVGQPNFRCQSAIAWSPRTARRPTYRQCNLSAARKDATNDFFALAVCSYFPGTDKHPYSGVTSPAPRSGDLILYAADRLRVRSTDAVTSAAGDRSRRSVRWYR